MKIEIIQSEFGYANLKFNEKPSKEILDELKKNGWGWSNNNGVWYPRTAAAKQNDQMFAYRFVAKYDPETARKYSEQQINDYAAEIKQSVQSDLPEPTEQIETLKEFTERIVQPIVEEYQKQDELKYQEQINSLNENSKKVYELLKATGNLTVEEMLVMVSKIDNAYATNNFDIENENEENDKEIINKLADDIIQEAYDNSASGFNYYLDYEEAAKLCGKTKDWIVSHINEIDDALMFHNDDELLDYVGEHEEPDSFNLNFCSVGEDHNELFKKENGRWIRKTDEELQEEGFNLDNELTDSEKSLIVSRYVTWNEISGRFTEWASLHRGDEDFIDYDLERYPVDGNLSNGYYLTINGKDVTWNDHDPGKRIFKNEADLNLYLYNEFKSIFDDRENDRFFKENLTRSLHFVYDELALIDRADIRLDENGFNTGKEIVLSLNKNELSKNNFIHFNSLIRDKIQNYVIEKYPNIVRKNKDIINVDLIFNKQQEEYIDNLVNQKSEDIYNAYINKDSAKLHEIASENEKIGKIIEKYCNDVYLLPIQEQHQEITVTNRLDEIKSIISKSDCKMVVSQNNGLKKVELFNSEKQCIFSREQTESIAIPYQTMEAAWDKSHNAEIQIAREYFDIIESVSSEQLGAIPSQYLNVVVEPNQLHSNELSWEELQNKIILDSDGITQLQNMERFQNLKDTRIKENPLETTKESKIMVAFEYLYDVVDWDVLVETESELNSDDNYHSKMMELRASILDKACEKLVEGSYENINDFTANFNILRDEAIANISKEYIQNPVVQNENNLITKKYEIYQIKNGEEYRDYRFSSYNYLHENGLKILAENYEKVYESSIVVNKNENITKIANELYEMFNINHPADFKGHSLSTSDILVVDGNVLYVDDVGFAISTDELLRFYNEKQVENNLSPDSETLAYDRVTNRYKEQYADFYKTFAQIQEMHLENESRYVSNARIREQYNQAFEELVKLSKQELVDIICEGINFEDSKSSAIRYINSVSPDVQRRMMCTTFGFKNYLDIDNRPTLGRMENGKYIAPTSEEINTYIKDEYDCNRLNGISIAELYQIKREVRDEGLPVKKMQTFINQYEEAKNTNDEKTIKKIEYYLEDIDYDTEVDLLRNGNYKELRNKYANITFGVLPLVEFGDNEPEMYDSIEDAFKRMEELNANNFINNDDLRYGISFHYDNGDYNNGNYIAIYEPFSYSQQNKLDITIFEADSHFRTPVVKEYFNQLEILARKAEPNFEHIDFDKMVDRLNHKDKIFKFEHDLNIPIPTLLQELNCCYSSWLDHTTDEHFFFYIKDGKIKSKFLNDRELEEIKPFLEEVEKNDMLSPETKEIKKERQYDVAALSSDVNTMQEAIDKDKLDLYFDKLISIVDNKIEELNKKEKDLENTIDNINPSKNEKIIELTQEDLDIAESIIPKDQYLYILESLNGEESEHFKNIIKNCANNVRELRAIKKENINEDGSHPCKFHFFIGSSEWFVSELDKDGYGFGYAILNGDLEMSEFGGLNICGDNTYGDAISKLEVNIPLNINGKIFNRTIGPEMDLYLENDTTIERELYKKYPEHFQKYKKYFDKKIELPKSIEELKVKILKDCIENNGNNCINQLKELIERNKFENVHLESLVTDAIKTGEPKVLNSLFNNISMTEQRLVDLLSSVDEDGNNSLHIAAQTLLVNPVTEIDKEQATMFETLVKEINDFAISKTGKDAENYIKAKLNIPNKNESLPFIMASNKNAELHEKTLAIFSKRSSNNIEESEINSTEENYGSEINNTNDRHSGNTFGSDSDKELEGQRENTDWGDNSRGGQYVQFDGSEEKVSMENNSGISAIDTESERNEIDSIHITRRFSESIIENDSSNSNSNGSSDMQQRRMEVGQVPSGSSSEQPGYGLQLPKLTKSEIKNIREKCKEILTKADNEITESEKEILAQYEGAGGLHEGGQSASAVLSEFYTPNNLIEKVWSIVDNYAPNAVTVLEPTAGTGRFANNRPNNQFTLHELDETSSRIAKILHPEATVHSGAYQKQFFDAGGRIHIGQQKNHYDVVIGNPPYGDYKDEWKGRGEGTEFQTYQEYFLSKGLEALKDKNSILAMVVPSGVLNSQNDKAKKLIAEKGQLIDAYRLPIKTFPTTEVGTDILIFRTWDSEIEKLKEQYKDAPEYQSNIQSIIESRKQSMAEEISDNFFFEHHPEKVLGEIVQKTNQFGKLENVCVCHEGLTVQDELNKIDGFLTVNNNVEMEEVQKNEDILKDMNSKKTLKTISNQNEFNVINFTNWTYFNSEKISTKVYDVEISASLYEQLLPSEYKERTIKEDEVVCIQYRKSVVSEEQDQFLISKFNKNNFMLLQQKEIQIDDELKNKIKSICNSYIEPTQTEEKEIEVEENLDDPSKRLYEDTEGLFKKQHKLSIEEFAKFYTGSNFTPEDYNIWGATDWQGNVDLSKLTQTEKEYLVSSDKYVETSEGVYTNAMLYATGNIYEKLDTLEEKKDTLTTINYERAKAILTNAIPKIVPIEKIKMDALSPLAEEFTVSREVTSSRNYMGRSEINTSTERINLREDFINWATNRCSPENFNEYNSPINSRRSINNYSIAKISREDIPEDISWQDIVNYIDRISVPTHIDEKKDTKEEKNRKNLIAGNKKDLRKNTCYELFNRYLQEGLPQEDKERLQHEWNKIYNASVQPDYKKLPLFINGMSTWKNGKPFMLYKQQVEGVSRLLSKGNGLLAYEVGVGKTAAGIVTTVGQLQTGRCKRPLIIVPNQVYKKWVNDFKELFPDIKINELYNLSDKYIKHCFDEETHSLVIEPNTVTVITDSALQKITFSDEVCNNELAEDFGYLLGLSEDLKSGDDKTIAEAQQRIQKEIGQASRIQVKKLPEGREQKIQQSYIFIDECGFDNVVIDEAHRYKNLFTVPKPKRGHKEAREFEGLGSGKPSVRAEKVFGLTTLIQRRNEDRNVFLLTATPFTNNPLEVYSMLSYMGRKELINRHIYDVRDFCTEFAHTKFEYSVKPSGEIEPKQVMKSFKGQKKLKNLVFDYIDQVSAKEAGINRPEGERHKVMLELSPLQDRIIKLEQETIAKSDNPYVVLKAMTTMRTATLSPALLDQDDFAGVEDIVIPPTSEIVESSPKLTWVCNTCADLYKQKPECGQFIYMPQGKDYFDEVKNYLIKQGIPEEAIDYIHSTHNGSAEDKDKISARFNDENDKLKILIGTATVAEGIDLNGNSIVEYNTMLGWNPTESIQVEGRIWRQGNKQGKVHIMYPLMENSIDSLIYQKHDEKTSRINSVLSKTDDGKDVIDIEEINPEELKFELITDPTKKVKMIINEKTAEKRKEIKVVENRIETIQELEEDRQNAKNLYDTNVAEKEKYKTLLKTAREELKFNPDNWHYQTRVDTQERNVDTCNKEIAKSKNRLNTISYNFNKFDIHDPEREVPIRVQELIVRKAELEAEITEIEQSAPQLVVEEQKKILQKKILSKPVEQQRQEMVQTVIRDTWYKEQTDDRNQKPPKPIEAVKDFVIPQEMLNIFDKAIEEKDYNILGDYLNWGNRDLIPGVAENDKAVEILRNRYEAKTGEKLPEKYTQTLDYLASVCNPNTVPEVMKFKTYEDVIRYASRNWHGEAWQRDGFVEYVTIDNYKKNRNITDLANGLKKKDGESYAGFGSCEYGYQSNAKGVEFDARINGKREKFFATWNQIAKIKAAELDIEYPREKPQRVESTIPTPTDYSPDYLVEQGSLFNDLDLKQIPKTLDITKNNNKLLNHEVSIKALERYKGLPPFFIKENGNCIVRLEGKDMMDVSKYQPSELIDIELTQSQMHDSLYCYLMQKNKEVQNIKFENPDSKVKVETPKPLLSNNQIELLSDNGIESNEYNNILKLQFYELLCHGENALIVPKAKNRTSEQIKEMQNKPIDKKEVIETEFDFDY